MKRFSVLAADPPWKFGDSLPGKGRGAAKHYQCMPTREICHLELPPLADDCVLFLWRVAAMQADALEVMRAWGFDAKSELVWLKTTATGKRHFGMGRYVRASHETCLIGVRGRGTRVIRDRSIRSVFEAPVGRHSAKPGAFYGIVERLCVGPYAEMFARTRRDGWWQHGDQLEAA